MPPCAMKRMTSNRLARTCLGEKAESVERERGAAESSPLRVRSASPCELASGEGRSGLDFESLIHKPAKWAHYATHPPRNSLCRNARATYGERYSVQAKFG